MKKSYQVEGLIWSWDRIPNFRSTAPISTIFKALEGEGGAGRWKGMVEGYGGRWKDGEGATGEISFYRWWSRMPNTNPALWAFSGPSLNWVWDFTFQAHLKSCSNLLVKLVHKSLCLPLVRLVSSPSRVSDIWEKTGLRHIDSNLFNSWIARMRKSEL